ncbi:MAG: CehA/McbA family metallohydrolase [Polyangiaceae bacterium]
MNDRAPTPPTWFSSRPRWWAVGLALVVAASAVSGWSVVGEGDLEEAPSAADSAAPGAPGAPSMPVSGAPNMPVAGASNMPVGGAGAKAPGDAKAARAGGDSRSLAPENNVPRFAESLDVTAFLRGNLHTHSSRSDGDSPPEDVYAYYRDHGYAFLAMTDHNGRTDPAKYAAVARPGFVMIPGEEVTLLAAGKPVHVNALCTTTDIGGGAFDTGAEALRWAVAQVKAQGAVALINHPNFDWALGAEDLRAGHGAALLEIWSGHPHVRTEGDADHPSHEGLWSKMLDAGETFAAVAVDDMHNLSEDAPEPAARPMRGWVQVFGAEPTEAAICDALRAGKLYASSGPELTRIRVGGTTFGVTATESVQVVFVGAEGAALSTVYAPANHEARYELKGGERHVRARIETSDGRRAWTQAYSLE